MWIQLLRRFAILVVGAAGLLAIPAFASAQQVYPIQCNSNNYSRTICTVGAPVIAASIFAQNSRTKCVIGGNVQLTDTGIVVSGGCRAYFTLTVQSDRPAYTFGCSSDRGVTRLCPAPEAIAQNRKIHAIWVGNQESDSPCTESTAAQPGSFAIDSNDNNSVAVLSGCRAQFNYTLE
jgi:hypothetical protein